MSRRAVLKGWHSEHEGIWRIPLVKRNQIHNDNVNTVLVDLSPLQILGDSGPPPINHILNVYELKAQSQLIRYYHAAAGFPTQSTWLAAIKNQHYYMWKGLPVVDVHCHFP